MGEAVCPATRAMDGQAPAGTGRLSHLGRRACCRMKASGAGCLSGNRVLDARRAASRDRPVSKMVSVSLEGFYGVLKDHFDPVVQGGRRDASRSLIAAWTISHPWPRPVKPHLAIRYAIGSPAISRKAMPTSAFDTRPLR